MNVYATQGCISLHSLGFILQCTRNKLNCLSEMHSKSPKLSCLKNTSAFRVLSLFWIHKLSLGDNIDTNNRKGLIPTIYWPISNLLLHIYIRGCFRVTQQTEMSNHINQFHWKCKKWDSNLCTWHVANNEITKQSNGIVTVKSCP